MELNEILENAFEELDERFEEKDSKCFKCEHLLYSLKALRYIIFILKLAKEKYEAKDEKTCRGDRVTLVTYDDAELDRWIYGSNEANIDEDNNGVLVPWGDYAKQVKNIKMKNHYIFKFCEQLGIIYYSDSGEDGRYADGSKFTRFYRTFVIPFDLLNAPCDKNDITMTLKKIVDCN